MQNELTGKTTVEALVAFLYDSATMMLIVFPDQRDWYKASWAFRQLTEGIVQYCSPTVARADLLVSCQWYNTLRLDETAEPLLGEMIQLLALVSEKTLSGEIPSLIRDSEMLHGYREAVSELLLLTRSEGPTS